MKLEMQVTSTQDKAIDIARFSKAHFMKWPKNFMKPLKNFMKQIG